MGENNKSATDLAIALLEELPALVVATVEVRSWLSEQTAVVKAMQAENRDPTDAEWSAMHDSIDSLRAALQGVRTSPPVKANEGA